MTRIQSGLNVKNFIIFYNSKAEEMWKEAWYLANIEDTEKILNEIGFRHF
jgi:tryptophanyl-tRNA synthetase